MLDQFLQQFCYFNSSFFSLELYGLQVKKKKEQGLVWIRCSVYSFFLLIQDQFTLTAGNTQNNTYSTK